MFDKLFRSAAALLLAVVAGPALAAVVTLSGQLDDAANTALVGSDMLAAQFTDEWATANNVALYELSVPIGGSVSFASSGFLADGTGGIDPYFTLFSGTDRASATFVESNYFNALAGDSNFTLATVLAAGDYTVAIGVFFNQALAENPGGWVLADGFTGLGGPSFFGDGSYRLDIALPDAAPVPEPSTAALCLMGLGALAWASRRRQTSPQA